MVPSAQSSLNPNREEGLISSIEIVQYVSYSIRISISPSSGPAEKERERGGEWDINLPVPPIAFRCLFDCTKRFNQTSFVMIRIVACRSCTLI